MSKSIDNFVEDEQYRSMFETDKSGGRNSR